MQVLKCEPTVLNFREVDFYNICDDWGIKHETAVEEGLENMPGGYPGSRIEEVLDETVE